jgi:D-amino-acid dehydrogenase
MELSGIDARLDQRRVRAIRRAANRYLATPPQWSSGEAWAGLRPITPDGLPLIGRLPGRHDILVATGHAMLGITLAPVTGMLIARIAVDDADPDIARPFDPSRFAR